MTLSRRGALGLALLAAPGVARAGAWHVPGDADTIAECLAFAAEWDVIYVDPATYWREDAVTVTRSVQIQSADMATPVDFPAFVVEGATLRLGNGNLYGDTWVGVDGAYPVETYAAVLVTDGAFEGHDLDVRVGYGHGVYAVDAQVSLTDSTVEDGHASRHPATSQCRHTSERNTHRNAASPAPSIGPAICAPARVACSWNFTWRHVEAPSAPVLS